MLADQVDYVIGVDTHRDEHVLAVVAAATGAVVAQRSVATTSRGYAQAFQTFAATIMLRLLVFGRSRGQVVTMSRASPRDLERGRGEAVLEAARCPRGERRLQGKDDQLDAVRAARAVLSTETLALPREGQQREALRLLMVARRSAVDVRREALVQLRSVIVTAPDGRPRRAARAACGAAARAL